MNVLPFPDKWDFDGIDPKQIEAAMEAITRNWLAYYPKGDPTLPLVNAGFRAREIDHFLPAIVSRLGMTGDAA